MRSNSHASSLIPAVLVIVSMLFPMQPALAAQPAAVSGNLWVDAQAGNDANSGLSASSALRTIQAAAKLAGPGATIHILPGIYREMVTPTSSGTAAARITYVAENGSGSAEVRGSVASSTLSWTRLTTNSIGLPSAVNPSNIYYADLSSWGLTKAPRFVMQMNAQGGVASRLPLAREPDWQVTSAWKYAEFWWAADGGSGPAACDPSTNQNEDCDAASRSGTQLTDTHSDSAPAGVAPGSLATLGNLTGATLVALDTGEGHYVYHRQIVAHDVAAGRVTVDRACEFDRGSGNGGLGWGSKYYVENLPSLLDTPGEWWYDAATARLYLWPAAAGSPATQNIEISRLSTGLRLANRSYTTIDGLAFQFFNGNAISESNNDTGRSYNNIIRNSILRYANIGVDVGQGIGSNAGNITDGFTLENSELSHMDTYAIQSNYWWPGGSVDTFTQAGIINTVIRGNEMYDLGFRAESDNTDGMQFFYPDRLRFEGNHVYNVAHNGVILGQSIIQSTKTRGFSPAEIKTGQILVKDNLLERACQLAADCGGIKIEGDAPDGAVHRDVLITGNVFRNTVGWSYVAEKRRNWSGGPNSQVKGMGGFGLYLDGASGVYVYRNIAYNNAWSGFHFYNGWSDGDFVLYNNIAANSLMGFYLGGTTYNDINTQIANNLILNNEGYGIWLFQPEDAYGNFVLDHNLYYNNGWRPNSSGGLYQAGDMALSWPSAYYPTLAAIQASRPWEPYGVEGDPAVLTYDLADHNLFDGSWPDFHPTPASVNAIDRGTDSLPASLANLLAMFNVDDVRVGNALDIGRYESSTPAETNIGIAIGGSAVGGYYAAPGGRATLQFPTAKGPVQVVSTKDGVVFTSERVHNSRGFINEAMGVPTGQLTTEYWFPWYDNLGMASWILAGNPSATDTAHVTINIAGTDYGPYSVAPGSVIAKQYSVMNGPVHVTSDINVVSSERVATGQGFVQETMGYPNDQLSTEYWFPWYDNLGMVSWILVGNPSTTDDAHVTISIAGKDYGSYTVAPGGRITPQFPLMNGPVHIVSDINVFASERVHGINGFVQETMGFAADKLTTDYYFPWYDNLGMASWILVGNPSANADAHVTIRIAGTDYGPYTVKPGDRITPRFGVMNGPVHIISDIDVFTSERVHTGQGFVQETMGYPSNELATEYWFPWYDNLTTTEWVLVARP